MKKIITIVIIIAIIAGLGYWIYPYLNPTPSPEEKSDAEQACIDSGGEVKTSICCQATSDFPNTCLIGPCGCAPAYSHEVKICDCGEEKCFDGHKCASSDEVLRLLEDLKEETGISFPEAKSVEFKWVVSVTPKVEETTIEGKGFEVEEISTEQYEKVDTFFKDKGFDVDPYNATAGTISEQTGYEKDRIVCTVVGGASGYKEAEGQWISPELDKYDIEVRCGKEEVVYD